MAEIDSLELKIIADATSASASIDKFVASLEKLSIAMGNIQNASALDQVATGISNLGAAMQSVASIDSRRFTTLANNIDRLGAVGGTQLSSAANGIFDLVVALDSVNNTTPETTANVANLANAIGRLGSANIERAVINIPKLTVALREMLTSLSTAPQISRNIIEMTNALANLAMQTRGMQTTTTNISSGFTNLTKSAKTSSRSLGGLATTFGKFYATFFLLIRGVKKIWASTESAMDYVETFNYYTVALDKVGKTTARAFGEMGENDAKAYTEKFTKKLKELNKKMTGYIVGDNGELINTDSIGLGLDPDKLMNFQAQIMGITNSVGLLGDASISTTKALSMLSADLSSLTNTDLETVMGNLRSGLIGQSRALYKYGIDVTSATLKQYALAYGIEKSVTEMSQSEKMQLRMLAILDQSRIAWGDQARTINTVANQYRILKQQVSNLGRTIGNLFLPIVQKVLPYINAFVILLQRLFEMLGLKLWGDSWLSDLNKDITSIGGGVDDIDDLSDSLDDAADSAKKLKGQLLGIDELNVINSKDGSIGKMSTIGGLDLSGAIADTLAEYERAWEEALKNAKNKAEEIANAIERAFKQFFTVPDTVSEKIQKIKDNVQRILDSTYRVWSSEEVQTKLKGLKEQAEKTATATKNAIVSVFASLGVGITGGIATAKEDLEKFNTKTVSSITTSFTNLLKTFEEIANAWGTIAESFESEGFQKIVEVVTKFFEVIGGIAIDTTVGAMTDIFSLFSRPIAENADKIKEALEHIFNIVGNLLSPLGSLFDVIAEKYDGYENSWIHKLFVDVTDITTDALGSVLDIINQLLEKVETSSEKVAEWGDNIKNLFGDEDKNPFEFVSLSFSDVKTNISTAKDELLENIKSLPTDIAYLLGKAAGKIYKWGKDVKENFPVYAEKMVEKFVSFFKELPSKIKEKLDKVKDKLTEWKETISNWIETELPTILDNIATAFSKLPEKLYEVGRKAIEGLWNGITEWWESSTEKVDGFIKDIIDAFKKGFDEHSPSRVFYKIGAYATEGLKLGMESLYDDTLRSVKDFTDELVEAPKMEYQLNANVKPSAIQIGASSDIATALRPVIYDAMNMALNSNQAVVNVTLEGDTDKIFKVVKDKSREFTRRTGLPAFT